MYDDPMQAEQMEKAYVGGAGTPATSKRQRLQMQRRVIAAKLSDIDKALAALDAHPELEEFIETLQRANI